jgi:ubiquinone/menaquinone biosynthesis C-methylase UbiE
MIAEDLCESADLRAGGSVLDVATGSGNAAIAAGRRGCRVTGLDYVSELLEDGRARAAVERVDVEFVEGDAEDLPFPTGSFDAVISCLGVMFAPDQERAAAELTRVCRRGGLVALASWTPDGFIGELFAVTARHVPPPPGLKPPVRWGTREGIAELLGRRVARLRIEQREFVFRFPSVDDFVYFFSAYYGPTLNALEALDREGRERLTADTAELVRRYDRLDYADPVAVPATYVNAIGLRC